jgi:predicted nuclease of predicted toxin-antitoxin system
MTEGLRLREVDVLTAQEDGAATLDDPVLLDRAMALGRVVFTQDEDFLREAHRR